MYVVRRSKLISIHALREEGDRRKRSSPCSSIPISIHALREEGDYVSHNDPDYLLRISIHALREEGDHLLRMLSCLQRHFYPRPPRGGRPLC